jgi:DNA-binding MarR family transcriptional regulator
MEDLLSESRHLSELLLSSSDLAREIFADIASELDISVPVARALCLLEKPEPMSGLALKLHCDKSYITPLTDQMESLGFVERVPGADRRTKMLELTALGEATRDKLESQIAQLSPVMTGLTQEERKSLKALLTKVAAAMGA